MTTSTHPTHAPNPRIPQIPAPEARSCRSHVGAQIYPPPGQRFRRSQAIPSSPTAKLYHRLELDPGRGARSHIPRPMLLTSALLRGSAKTCPLRAARRHASARQMSSSARHAQFYSEFAAGMIPVALLGSAVYMVRPAGARGGLCAHWTRPQGLRTWQQHLAHERFLEEAQAHVQHLEAEVTALRQQMQTGMGAQDGAQGVGPPGSTKSRWWLW
ncbi:hypothetical protein BC628DRAFT_1360689 [Trametes gibbosa]|nr:hypothetical protein BC628DRAFT_1360689 [Trametes gibbosa]